MKWIFRLFSVALLIAALSVPVYLHYKKNGDELSLSTLANDAQQAATRARDKAKKVLADFSKDSEAHETRTPPLDSSLISPSKNQGANFGSLNEHKEPSDSATRLYQWQDESGQWYFSDTAPDDDKLAAKAATRIIDSKDVMSVPAITITTSNEPLKIQTPSTIETSSSKPLSFDSAINVMDNAKAAAAQMELRNQALKEVVGDQ